MITAVKDNRKKSNQSGQALIELIIFLPLMFTLYSMVNGFVSAINSSINQQKVTRAYLYYRVQNNSNIPKPDPEETWQGWNKFGMFFIGWKDYFSAGDTPVMPCHRITIPLSSRSERCEEPYTEEKAQYIRVGTVYGLCGATYGKNNNIPVHLPDLEGNSYAEIVDISACTITQ